MNIDLVALLERVKAHEQLPVGEYKKLPADIEEALDKVAGVDEMFLLKTVHNMFENWAVTVYRGGKIPACGLFCVPTEVFVHDRGDEGSNGKTVLQTIVSVLCGDYFAAIDDTMLTKKPPHASQCNAAMFPLIGRRCLGTPEVEDTLKIQSAWMKKLADPSTVWSAREPHGTAQVSFKISSMFAISTNAKLQFTRLDGGVQRRGIGCPFDLTFVANPQPGTNQRKESTLNLKDLAGIRKLMPGLYYFVECVYRVFYQTGYHKTPGRMPLVVQQATEELRREELASVVKEVIDNEFEAVESDGMTIAKMRTYLAKHRDIEAVSGRHVDTAAIEAALSSLVRTTATRGVRKMLYNGSEIKRT